MNIKTYQNFSKRVNETKVPTTGGTDVTVELKQATSIANPVFILSGFDPSMNYIEVPGWSRKYFVTDFRKGNNDLFEVSCAEDYAGTWKSNIGNYTCFIERSASNYNTKIHDGSVSNESGVTHTDSATTSCGFGNLGIIMRVMGREDNGGIGTYYTTLINMSHWFGNIFGQIDTDPTFADIQNLVVVAASNPAQYVVGVYTTPIGAATYGANCTNTTLYMGGHKTDISIDKITTHTASIGTFTIAKPTGIYNDFRKYDPSFSRYTLYIPTIGEVALSGDLIDTTLTVDVGADLLSGDLFFALKSDGDVFATYTSNCYSSFGVGGVNPLSGVLSSALGTAAALTNPSPIGAVSGVISGVRNVMQESPSIISTQGGNGCIAQHKEMILTVVQRDSGDIPTAVVGRPCCKNLQIGNLSGYVKCGNASIDIPGTKAEKDAVNALLNGGFYYT